MVFEPPSLEIFDERPAPGTRVVALAGELHLSTAPELRARLSRVISLRPPALIVDLSGVEFIDSTGLSVLLGALRRVERSGGRLALVAGSATVMRLFHITRLDETFAICATREEALERVGATGDGR
ncbi:MAG TPA: STAS domain-containing protein [Solirubrobacteraceae bacterium]|nr:STAS domain-containing protein [Solirubrobacteraceae bacterium]